MEKIQNSQTLITRSDAVRAGYPISVLEGYGLKPHKLSAVKTGATAIYTLGEIEEAVSVFKKDYGAKTIDAAKKERRKRYLTAAQRAHRAKKTCKIK